MTSVPSSTVVPSDTVELAASDGRVVAACATPTSRLAPVIYLHTRPTYPVGETPPPDPLDTQTLYIGGGEPGVGLLCHGSTTSGPPALSATPPAAGAVPYLAEDGNGVWGAVGPGVTTVELVVSGYQESYSFTVDNPDITLELRDLGAGWHAFNTDVGFSPPKPSATAIAYDASGRVLGRRVIPGSG